MTMHDICIVMHMTKITRRGRRSQRVRRRRAAAPAARPPRRRDRRPDRRLATPASRSGVLQPHLIPLAERVLEPTTPEVLAGHDVVFLALPHGAVGRHRRGARRRRRRHRLRRRLPARRRRGLGAVLRRPSTPAPGPTACPSCPAQRDALRGATRIAVPGCYPTVSTLALVPALAAGLVEPDVVVVAASGTSGAGKAAKPHLLGSRGDGQRVGLRRRRRPPAHPRDRAEPRAPSPASRSACRFTPVLVPMPRGILATCSAPLAPGVTADDARAAYAKAYADEPFVHVLPAGPVAADPGGARLQRRAPPGDRRRARRPPGRRRRRRQPHQGHRRRRRAVHEPRPRPRRDHRPDHASGSRHERHRTRRASAPPASPPGSSPPAAKDVALVVNDGPVVRRRRRCSPPTAARPTRCCGASRSSRTASCGPSSSTPAAPTATPAPTASRPPTPSPSGSPSGSASARSTSLVCSTGLIGAGQPDATQVLAGVDAAYDALAPRRRRRRGRTRS